MNSKHAQIPCGHVMCFQESQGNCKALLMFGRLIIIQNISVITFPEVLHVSELQMFTTTSGTMKGKKKTRGGTPHGGDGRHCAQERIR